MNELALPPVDSVSLADKVTRTLRQSILDGTISAESRLTEPELARQLNTSRGPVREALRRLEQEGLVKSQAYKSVTVLANNSDEVERVLLPIRVILEQYSAERALGQFGPSELEQLRTIVDAMREAAHQGNSDAVGEADLAFHRYLVENGGGGQCAQIWLSIQPRLRFHFSAAREAQRLEDVTAEHEQLLRSIQEDSADKVFTEIQKHIENYHGPEAK